mgnify:CR=1 FL=1
MSAYRPTIGLEVHAELATATKMFCACTNNPTAETPNTNVCPVCMAHPGTLPVANREAVHQVLRVGTALGSTLADFSEFDRKSYFYPDIPKGYQISQYEHPLVKGGSLNGVAITRVHLEEDTARSSHTTSEGVSLVDFNRAGVPLMELVTDPVMHDAQTAGNFARELQLLLRTLGASHANLEKGEMRVEANVSVAPEGQMASAYVEIKNLNSFRSVERAIAFEIERQSKLLDEGGTIVKETRGWDEAGQRTFSQRTKEGAADYRYFPEPDLPKLMLSEIPEFSGEALKASMPELPWERRARYASLGLKESDVVFLGSTSERGTFFDAVITDVGADPALLTLAANYLISDVAGWYTKNEKDEYESLTSSSFVSLIRLVAGGDLSSRGAKDVLSILLEKGGDPETIAREGGFVQMSDEGVLRTIVTEVLAAHEGPVSEYRAGKEASLQFLVGMSMKASKGAGNPAKLKELLLEELTK